MSFREVEKSRGSPVVNGDLSHVAMYSFIVLIITGTFLALFFEPSRREVAYHGSYTMLDSVPMSQAYASTLNISFEVRGGLRS